ncbi:MAG: 3-hydroxybutyryl-CoA dehydrogenase [Chitinophagaceae bacterium]|nr:3-hydroxybutyryl-CoA dehydrogenase [Chitinophagaceae bacterium]
MIKTICVCGAGTMGSGIAQVSAQSGFKTILFDLDDSILEKAKINITNSLQFLCDKQKITPQQKESFFNSILFTSDNKNCIAEVVIEAIVEKIEAKTALFNLLSIQNSKSTIFATNTSSLPVTAIQKNVSHPERVVGMHFFNPAPVMKLVEVVKGEQTSESVLKEVFNLCEKMNKVPVICNDAPGFIVNRVARHYYLEAMKLSEEGVATFENIDKLMEASGFKMGPFKLMDLIGMDINLSVSQSLYKAFNNIKRFEPSQTQIDKVKSGDLGRKTGKGFYSYPVK